MAKLAIARLSCYLLFTSPPFGQPLCPFSQLHSIAYSFVSLHLVRPSQFASLTGFHFTPSSLIHFSMLQSTRCLLLCARGRPTWTAFPLGLLRFSCIVQPPTRLPNCLRKPEISSKSLINRFEHCNSIPATTGNCIVSLRRSTRIS